MTAWGKSELGKVIRKIDVNTRAIAKLVSAQEYLHDYAKHEPMLEDLKFTLVQERRNLKAKFEDEFQRQQTRR
jgi:hypothetical protein